jgi:hypothetical protein
MTGTITPEITLESAPMTFVRHRRRSIRPAGLTDSVPQATVGTPIDKTATKMQGVHTLVAMPQWYINFNLDDLLQHGRTTGGASLRDVALRMTPESDAWLRGVISKIATTVYVPENPAKVTFLVTFRSGTMEYDEGGTKHSCDITGLRFGLHVDLGKAEVAVKDYSQLPDDVRQRIGALKPGAFSVEQLFMNLQAAKAADYDPASTSFPPAMPAAAIEQFPRYMTQYLGDVANAGGQVLGYAVQVPNGDDPISTFPPTGLKLVTNQYRGGTDSAPVLNPDVDTVSYLMMTGDKAFPSQFTPWWGNFVLPTDGKDDTWYGTIAMARELFIDKFLLPRLSPLVCGYWKLSNTDSDLNIRHEAATGSFAPTTLGGTWKIGALTSRSHRTNTWSNDDVDYSFSWDVSLNLVPGTNKVVINRVVNFDMKYTHWYGIEGHAVTSTCQIWYNVPLAITITFLGVIDGKLQVKVSTSTREPAPNTVYGDPYGWDITKVEGNSSIWKDVSDTLDQVINSAVAAAMPGALATGVEKAIADNLNLTPFVFPGGNQLNMINPVFNDEGDLLLGLSYKS